MSETDNLTEKIQSIIAKKDMQLSQSDLDEIDGYAAMIDPREITEIRTWLDEAIELVINDPLYEGDIQLE